MSDLCAVGVPLTEGVRGLLQVFVFRFMCFILIFGSCYMEGEFSLSIVSNCYSSALLSQVGTHSRG